MASKKQISKIKELAAQGQSVNTIKEELNIPKSTVYYHFKKEVGQKQKENALIIPKDEETIGELCGIFAGDGNFHKKKEGQYRIRIFLNLNDDYWEDLADFLEKELEKRPNIYHYEDKSRATLDYSSKELYELFKNRLDWGENKTRTVKLANIDSLTEEFKVGFVRGLIDTDGHKETKFRRYIYGTVSKELRNNFSKILDELDIDHTKYCEESKKDEWPNMHKVRISGNSAEKFSNKIRPRHPKKQDWEPNNI